MVIITALLGEFLPYIVGFVAVVGGLLGWNAKSKRDAVKKERAEAKEADHEHAEDIRDRVANADERLREFDDAGFRD